MIKKIPRVNSTRSARFNKSLTRKVNELAKTSYVKTLVVGEKNAIYAMWPYVAIQGFDNTMYLLNAFDSDQLKRIILPFDPKEGRLCQMFISVENDLFFMIENFKSNMFELWNIDLDSPHDFVRFEDQKIQMKKIFEYSLSDVKNRILLDVFIRSASKSSVNDNKKLYVFFLHKGGLYMWNETSDSDKVVKVLETTSLDIIEASPTEFFVKNYETCYDDNNCATDKCSLVVSKVSILFSTYKIDEMYREPHNEQYKMKGMAIDIYANKLFLMQKVATRKNELRFVILDMAS